MGFELFILIGQTNLILEHKELHFFPCTPLSTRS